ncbi:protein ERGIC-53-like [Ostrea edulis]|uniref:protein ERGIC-53-like n=1 Tax=Ostrea edulis TaxID=37623 RepID=UPI0024AF070C|nr:protein ERGIC-53-like [Ostrea edulis]
MLSTALVLCSVVFLACGTQLKPRFEYKYSFKGPHLTQSNKSIPFWDYGGDAIAGEDNIRLAPSIRSKKGWAWTNQKTNFNQWSVECVFKVTGRGRVGADGLGVWFTEDKGQDGPVYGNQDMWRGLGVFMDSFDNDGQHNNPYIMAMVNDGTQQYDHQSDGSTQQIGGCLRDFRNKPYPVRVKVEYYNKILTVFVNNGLTNNKDDFELCLRQENVNLPDSGYFGITAATGGLADDHDVLAFLAHSLHSQDQQPASQVPEQERQKYEKEFDDYYKELEQAKENFQKQHPGKQPGDYESMFEAQEDRELRMIFDGQNEMHNTLKELNRKLDELMGRQEMVLSRVSQLTGGNVQVAQGGTAPPIIPDTIKRHEVDQVMSNQAQIMNDARDIKQVIYDVQQRTGQIQGNIGMGGGSQGGGGFPQDVQNIIYKLQENMNFVRSDLTNIANKPQGQVHCPEVQTNCLSPMLFFVAIALQLLFIIGYMVYRSNKEAQAKKFY